MRYFAFFFFLLLISNTTLSQVISNSKSIPTTYDRSSLTVLFLDFSSGNHWNRAKNMIPRVTYSDKFDNNNFDTRTLSPTFTRSTIPAGNLQGALANELRRLNTGNMIISRWYNRKPDGTMDMELVHQRGRFSATDSDYLRAKTTKRGNAILEDYGNRLVNLSYILVVDLHNIKTMKEAGYDKMRGWQANVLGYLYKIDFNDQVKDRFYETWIYDDDSDEEKVRKQKAFNELVIPVVPIIQRTIVITASQPEGDTGIGAFIRPKSEDELLLELVQKSYDEILYRIEMEVEDFKVKTPLFATRPLRAKIGLKEGLKTDQRFFVYEHVYNSKTDQIEVKKRGVIRASSKSNIIDNRKVATGDMGTSKFYQVAGFKLEAGFTLQQNNDLGVELTLGPEIGNTGGGLLRIDYRLGRFVGVPALYSFIEGGYDFQESTSSNLAFLRGTVGFAKGIQLLPLLELRPYIGIGYETTKDETVSTENISSLYLRGGANLALNLIHNFQLVGGVGIYEYFLGLDNEQNPITPNPWDSYGRSGSTTFLGVKLMF